MSEDIEAKLADVSRRFNDARARKDALDQELKDIDAELFRLQGENRALQNVKSGLVDEALKVEAKPAKVEAK